MALFPRIDSPCPLSQAEQRGIDGHCARCDRHVHKLDGLDDAQRQALLASARGSLCVSYRVPRRELARSGGRFGVAIAATLIASTVAYADDPAPIGPTASGASAAQMSPVPQTPVRLVEPEGIDSLGLDEIFVGGVDDPQDAGWIDDGRLPELPSLTLPTDTAGDEGQAEDDLDEIVVVGGGVHDPGDPVWIERADGEDTRPELPVVDVRS